MVYRFLLSNAQNIAKRDKDRQLTDADIQNAAKHSIKQNEEAIRILSESSTSVPEQKVTQEIITLQKEIDLLKEFLPEQLDEKALKNYIDMIATELGDKKSKGLVMRSLKEMLTGFGLDADMALASKLVDERLA